MKKFMYFLVVTVLLLKITVIIANRDVLASTYSGKCGTSARFSFNSNNGELIITGTGKITDYNNEDSSPWSSYANEIEKVIVSDGITHIGSYSFYEIGANTFSIANTVKTIGDYSFAYNKMNEIQLPSGLQDIGTEAFYSCEKLNRIIIPDNVKTVGDSAFGGCRNMQSAHIGDGVQSIGEGAFKFCEEMTSVYLGRSLSVIKGAAFQYTKLNEIVLPNSLKTIEGAAFANISTNIDTIVIPSGVTTIDFAAFAPTTTQTISYFFNNIVILNKNCTLVEGALEANNICGYADSTAENYANRSSKRFIAFCSNHLYATDKVEYVANCQYDGRSVKLCQNCNFAKYTIATKFGHNFSNSIKRATLSNNGKISKVCLRCKKRETVTIAKIALCTLSKSKYTYNGKMKKPSVIIKDSKGKIIPKNQYSVSYPVGRKKVGKYSVKIKFNGIYYSGSKTQYFTIVPKNTKVTSIKGGRNIITLKWMKQKIQNDGYEIQYSIYSNFKKVNETIIKGKRRGSKTIKNLNNKKKYYVRIRTYKSVKIKGKTIKLYSKWSKKKSVLTY